MARFHLTQKKSEVKIVMTVYEAIPGASCKPIQALNVMKLEAATFDQVIVGFHTT